MALKNLKRRLRKSGDGFRISIGPVVRVAEEEQLHDLGDLANLSCVHGEPILYAIARGPRTIFAYWNIDWPAIFTQGAPEDRQAHLRVRRDGYGEELSTAVELLAGNHYLTVAQPRGVYRVEIGYYQPQHVWHPVATSDTVTMPPERVSDDLNVDLATVPFHLSFQRLIDLFRASNRNALAEIISRLQGRALTDEERALLTPEEWEILRAMNLSLEEIGSTRRAFPLRANEPVLRKRAEAVLGFGATSPAHGFGGSSQVSGVH